MRILLLALMVSCGCQAAPPAGGAGAESAERLAALLGDYMLAVYEGRRDGPDPAGGAEAAAPGDAEVARAALAREMVAVGILGSDDEGEPAPGLVRRLREFFHTRSELRFLPARDPVGGGVDVTLVRLGRREPDRRLDLWGREVRYHLAVFEETVIPGYAAWRLARGVDGDGASAAFVPAYIVGETIYFDAAELRRVGRERFFAREDHLREVAAAATGGALEALAAEGDAAAYYAALRDALRWRALGDLAEATAGLSPEERETRFVDRFIEEDLVREVATLHFGGRWPDRAEDVAEAALWSQLAFGEPIPALASVVAIHAEGARAGREAADRNYHIRVCARILEAYASALGVEGGRERTLAALLGLPAGRVRDVARRAFAARFGDGG
ncbi:MAG: hypothetical protein HY722_02740 [Planctomycetes bacterium]|nr:hypothetical protein [Planctomycetota bacterium]